MPGTRLFNPSDSLSPRDPQDNRTEGTFIDNPPRYAQLGGLSSASRPGIKRNQFAIKMPGATIRKVPVS